MCLSRMPLRSTNESALGLLWSSARRAKLSSCRTVTDWCFYKYQTLQLAPARRACKSQSGSQSGSQLGSQPASRPAKRPCSSSFTHTCPRPFSSCLVLFSPCPGLVLSARLPRLCRLHLSHVLFLASLNRRRTSPCRRCCTLAEVRIRSPVLCCPAPCIFSYGAWLWPVPPSSFIPRLALPFRSVRHASCGPTYRMHPSNQPAWSHHHRISLHRTAPQLIGAAEPSSSRSQVLSDGSIHRQSH